MTPISPDSSRWKLIDQILDELLDSSASQRETILKNRCGADEGLRLEVEKLLAATEKAADFMEVSAVDFVSRDFQLENTRSLFARLAGAERPLSLIGRRGGGQSFFASLQGE